MKRFLQFLLLLMLMGCLNTKTHPEHEIVSPDISAASKSIQGSAEVIKEVVKNYPVLEQRDEIILSEADLILEITGPLSEKERKVINERIKKVTQDKQVIQSEYTKAKQDNASLKQAIISQDAQHRAELAKVQAEAKAKEAETRKKALFEKSLAIGSLFIVGGGLAFVQAFIIGFSRVYGLVGQIFGVAVWMQPYLLDVVWFMPILAVIVIITVIYVIYGIVKFKKTDSEWEAKYNTVESTLKTTVEQIEEWKKLDSADKQTLLDTLSKKMDTNEKQLVKEIRKETI